MKNIIETLTQFIDWLNGKKTKIGAACLLLVVFANQVLVGVWGMHGVYLMHGIDTVQWLGEALTTVGFIHAGYKVKFNKPADTENTDKPDQP